MLNIEKVIEGTVYNIFNINEDLYDARIVVCRSCPLWFKDSIFGEVCNPMLYVKKGTNETSSIEKEGYINGCGCILRSKCRLVDQECPLERW